MENERKVIDFFENLLGRYGYSVKSLAYGSEESQRKKFEVLTQIGDLSNATILDVGCGFGDLYDFLKNKGLKVDYWGCDISPKMIELAKEKRPFLRFEVADILTWADRERFDYVLSTGFNCVKTGNNESLLRKMIEKMYGLCRIGVAVGMVSTYQTNQNEQTYYASPEDVFSYCMSLCKRVVLRHDYMPHDFTIYLYKREIIR